MKCSVAIKVNSGINPRLVSKYGAKSIAQLSDTTTKVSTFEQNTRTPNSAKLDANTDVFSKGASYIFSNNKKTTTQGLKNINITDKEVLDKLGRSGANLFKGISENYFTKNKSKLLSEYPSNSTKIIAETRDVKSLTNIKNHDFIVIGDKEIKDARKVVSKLFEKSPTKSDGQGYANEEMDMYNEGLEFLIISALHRGFDVAFSSGIDPEIVSKAVSRYNKNLKSPGTDVSHISDYRLGPNIVKVTNSVDHIIGTEMQDNILTNVSEIDESSLFLNAYLSEDERKTFNKIKTPSNAAKFDIANKIIKVFKRVVPNLNVSMLSSAEIQQTYGRSFSTKKGFILNDEIILNINKFDSGTMFHEFGHFYMKWLKNNNPTAHGALLNKIKEEYPQKMLDYAQVYGLGAIEFSKDDIAEEVFVDSIGMKAAKIIDAKIEEDYIDIGETVSEFTESFLINLTNNTTIKSYEAGFNLNSTISDMFNIAARFSYDNNPSPLYDNISVENLENLKNFFIPKSTSRDLFNGLMARNFIRSIRPGVIILTDGKGNRYNIDGKLDSSATYELKDWDTPRNILTNNMLLNKAEGYLNMFKNEAIALYSVTNKAITTADIIRKSSKGVKLTEDEANYIVDGELLDRTTHFLTTNFSNEGNADDYAARKAWKNFTDARKKTLKGTPIEIEEKLLEESVAWMKGKYISGYSGGTFKKNKKDLKKIFEFKTNEGTYLHNLAEFYFRALNFANSDAVGGKSKKQGGYLHFSESIINEMTKGRDVFSSYIQTNFLDKIADKKGSPEYNDFVESFDFLLKAMEDKNLAYARDFLKLVKESVVKKIKDLPGPIVIMPEVKLGSKTFGVAGTIDLIVVDGNGKAHIFDYKTKETGKVLWWDYNAGVRMEGVMSSYSDNSKMKASIQTSLYKILLMELGIESGPSSIFYVENILHGPVGGKSVDVKQPDGSYKVEDVLDHDDKLLYQPTTIVSKGVTDVSAELLVHFKKEGVQSSLLSTESAASATMDTIYKASGNHNIDIKDNLDEEARTIYENAINATRKSSSGNAMYDKVLDQLGMKSRKKGGNGLRVTLAGFVKVTLPGHIHDKDSSIAYIKGLLKDRRDIRNVEADLEKVFYELDRDSSTQDSILKSRDKGYAMRALLDGTDSNSYEFIKMSSNASLGLEFSGVSMLKNKITGETRMIILNHDRERRLKFEGDNRGNIFGNYISTKMAKSLSPTTVWENTNYNMRLIKAGIMMALQKKLDKNFQVSMVVSNSEFAKNSLPQPHDVSSVLAMTKIMLQQMKLAGEKLAPEIEALLKDPKLFETKSYMNNPITSLGEYLNMSQSDLVRTGELFAIGNKTARKRQKLLKDIVDNYGDHKNKEALLERLHDFRISLTENVYATVDSRINSDLWALTDNIIMYLHGFNYTTSPKNTTFANNFLVATSKSSNMYQGSFNRKILDSSRNINEDYLTYKNEHTKYLTALKDYYGGSGVIDYFSSSGKVIFKNLYQNDNTKRATAFRLKPSNHHSLAQAEKDYLAFAERSFKKFSVLSSFKKPFMKEGWMPLMPKSHMSYRQDTSFHKQFKDTFSKMRLDTTFFDLKENTVDNEFSVESKFIAQYTKDSDSIKDNFTFARRKILGIDQQGQEVEGAENKPLDRIEDNLENVLDNFAIAALDSHHYRDVSSFGRAMFYNIKRFEGISGGVSYHHLIDTLTLIQRRVINHKESDERSTGIKVLNKFATHAAIAGTVSQALLETFTNPMVTASNYIGDKLYGVMFNGQREFSLASYTKAFKLVTVGTKKEKDLMYAIDRVYGITNSDTKNLKQLLNQLEKKSLFQSRHLMIANKMMLENWQRITMLAYMMEQGSFEAHSLDENGNLQYDEKKDKRFFDSKHNADEKIKAKKMYAATKEEMANQRNGLTGTFNDEIEKRKLKRAWTGYEANYIKEMIVEVYSSLDESSKSLATYYTWMSFLSKMRTWLFAKIPRYFQKPMTADENRSVSRLKRVEDPDAEHGYRMSFEGEPTEGIVYTIQSMARQAAEHKFAVFQKGTLNDKQKKNISTLFGDLIVWGTLSAAAWGIFNYGLDDESRSNEAARLAYDRWMMATGDVFLMKSLTDVLTGNSSMLISASIASGAVKSIVDVSLIAPKALISGDEVSAEDYMTALHNVGKKLSGPYKSITLMTSSIFQED